VKPALNAHAQAQRNATQRSAGVMAPQAVQQVISQQLSPERKACYRKNQSKHVGYAHTREGMEEPYL
jgi:hypothetical protein